MSILKCPICGQVYNEGNNYYCLKCNIRLQPISKVKEPKNPELSDVSNRVIGTISQSTNQHIPKCPTCQSTDIRKIGGVERGASILTFGLFSKKINKTFKCNNCDYTW